MRNLFLIARILAVATLLGQQWSARAQITTINYWRMGEADPGAVNGGVATTLIDSIGGATLTNVGALHYTNDVAVANGFVSTLSVNFSGKSYAIGPVTADIVSVSDNFGIEAWVKLLSPTNSGIIAYAGGTGGMGGSTGFGIIYDANRQAFAGLYGGVDVPGDQPNSATNNVWADVAMVRQEGVTTVYVNGVPQSYRSGAGPNALTLASHFSIGTTPELPDPNQTLNGLVDEVRIFTFAPGNFYPTNLWTSPPLQYPTAITNRLALGTTNLIEGGAAGTDSVLLNDTLTNNAWTAAANAGWLHVTGTNQSGAGNSVVVFGFDANPGAVRTGTLTIATKTVTVTQAPASYSPAQMIPAILPPMPSAAPPGVALDPHGNVYFSDPNNNEIWEWNVTNQTVAVVPIPGLSTPQFLATDHSGNLFIAGGSTVEEWAPGSQTLTTVVSGFGFAGGICADTNGNVFVSDGDNGAILKWSAGNHAVTIAATNLDSPASLCVDGIGNIYYADTDEGALNEVIASNQTLITLNITTNLNNIGDSTFLVFDGTANIYITDYDTNLNQNDVLKWIPTTQVLAEIFVDGAANVSAMSLDAAGNVYLGRNGAYGLQKWTLANQTLSNLALSAPVDIFDVAVDSSNNLYIADQYGAAVGKWTATNGSYAPLITTGLRNPVALAVDGAGNIYVADSGLQAVLEFNPLGAPITTIMGNLSSPAGLALDAAGNLYVSEAGNRDVLEWIAASNSVITFVPPDIFGFPQKIALDVTGKLYVADAASGRIAKWNPLNQTTPTVFSLYYPLSVAVDGSGNVYSQDNNSGEFLRWQPKDNTVVNVSPGVGYENGLAFDSAGNLFTMAPNNQSQLAVIPYAYVNTNGFAEGFRAGTGSLPMVIPSTFNFLPPVLRPASDQSWLTITGVNNGVASFAFAANTTGDPRTADITFLGQTVAVTQPANPPTLINPIRLSGSTFEFGLTNLDTNNTFTVSVSTNVTLPLTNWTVLGTATYAGPGLMQFTDPHATNSPRFYIVH